jgi:hypothetical protein
LKTACGSRKVGKLQQNFSALSFAEGELKNSTIIGTGVNISFPPSRLPGFIFFY